MVCGARCGVSVMLIGCHTIVCPIAALSQNMYCAAHVQPHPISPISSGASEGAGSTEAEASALSEPHSAQRFSSLDDHDGLCKPTVPRHQRRPSITTDSWCVLAHAEQDKIPPTADRRPPTVMGHPSASYPYASPRRLPQGRLLPVCSGTRDSTRHKIR
ncbi:hypothetical protein WOLCODRAFT_139319 [Wolfiporia cocos MD-104 SS10]|uniref:Uncharacterized protein n=1 Tax=Wolfiporia cocos (strain MD-104) TaxID=742152 RepID=A0A2H3K167_WOLCO|nr:hypothetical protein WOLCODRAFT_139319 [Wolfiporia cocos MD-104 SS10]